MTVRESIVVELSLSRREWMAGISECGGIASVSSVDGGVSLKR